MKLRNILCSALILCISVLLSACNGGEGSLQETASTAAVQTEQTTESVSPTEYELFSLSPADYAYVVTANGKTGERIRWDDAETMQMIIDKLNGYRYTQTDDTVLEGWTAGINFYSAEDALLLSVVIGSNEIRYNQMRYLRPAPEGEEYFDAEFLLQYFHYEG